MQKSERGVATDRTAPGHVPCPICHRDLLIPEAIDQRRIDAMQPQQPACEKNRRDDPEEGRCFVWSVDAISTGISHYDSSIVFL